MYGDAYLFKLLTENQQADGSGRAMYLDLGFDFIVGADKKEFPKKILKKLLSAPSKQAI